MTELDGQASSPAVPEIVIDKLGINEAADALPALQDLFDGAYHNSHMYAALTDDIAQRPAPFRLFVARLLDQPEAAVGAAVIEHKIHPGFDYLGFDAVHIKRFTVAEAVRGMKIGKRLLTEATDYAFGETGLNVIFGESNEIGALAFYGREGALYDSNSIRDYWRRNTPEQSRTFFAADINDPRRRNERYPQDDGIRFAFAGNGPAKQFLEEHHYISRDKLIKPAD